MSWLHDGYFTSASIAIRNSQGPSRRMRRQQDGIELIASENIVSRLVLQAQGSVLTNKTVEGPPYGRYYGGAEFADAIEALAIDRARRLFRCRFANAQPHSGSNANAGVFLGLLKLATDSSMNVAAGGHISHGHPATLTGRDYKIASYGVNQKTERIDLDESAIWPPAQAKTDRRRRIGLSPRHRLRRLARHRRRGRCLFMVDMAHFAGLVVSGLYPDPFPHAHVATTTTYKSLRGARGGLALWNDEGLRKRIDPGISGRARLGDAARRRWKGGLPRRGASSGVSKLQPGGAG